ncbi:MAG: T9SS type A sorting domain-containing protein [candidate division WOR-3 bacterium]
MLIALLISDKAVPQEITVAKVKGVTVTEMQVENLRRMGLNDQTAISEIPVKNIDLGIYPSKGGITINGNGEYRIYRVNGKLIRFGILQGSKTIDLPRGAYIVKFNGKEITVIVR